MARRTRFDILADLPKFRTTQDDITIVGGNWELDRGDLKHKLFCSVNFEDHKRSEIQSVNGGWTLIIMKIKNARGKLSRGWEAYIGPKDEKDTSKAEMIGRGSDKGWDEPIKTLRYFGVLRALRKLGAEFYRKECFAPIRPFTVKYPWDDPEEPNAKYSPFTYQGSTYDQATDGVAVMFHKGGALNISPTYEMRKFIREQFKANAFVTDPDPQGFCILWHRNDMSVADRIHIDDWRARLIAGAE